MAAINHNDPKYRMNYVAGGNPNARRDTLTNAGPLKLSGQHYFVAVLPSRDVPDIGNGEFGFTHSGQAQRSHRPFFRRYRRSDRLC